MSERRVQVRAARLEMAPYAIGVFMLTPFVLWFALWTFAFPGPKPGFDVPWALAMLVVSLPLAGWHYLVGLGTIANSIAGRPTEQSPVEPAARRLIDFMPALTMGLGVLAFGALLWIGEPLPAAMAPLATALALTVFYYGARKSPDPALAAASDERFANRLGLVVRAVSHVPIVGWMVREVTKNPERGLAIAMVNGLLAWVLAVVLFGFAGLVIPAMGLVVVVFVLFLGFARM